LRASPRSPRTDVGGTLTPWFPSGLPRSGLVPAGYRPDPARASDRSGSSGPLDSRAFSARQILPVARRRRGARNTHDLSTFHASRGFVVALSVGNATKLRLRLCGTGDIRPKFPARYPDPNGQAAAARRTGLAFRKDWTRNPIHFSYLRLCYPDRRLRFYLQTNAGAAHVIIRKQMIHS
jgi:hypothetical protein